MASNLLLPILYYSPLLIVWLILLQNHNDLMLIQEHLLPYQREISFNTDKNKEVQEVQNNYSFTNFDEPRFQTSF